MTEHEAVAHITEMRDIIKWMLALIDGKEQMPKPGDEIYEAMALALENTKDIAS